MLPFLPNLDLATRRFWRHKGRPVDLTGEHAWLAAPMNRGSHVADGWLAEAAREIGG